MPRKIIVTEAPSNLGLKQFGTAEPGVKDFSKALLQPSFLSSLAIDSTHTVEALPYSRELDSELQILNVGSIVRFSTSLAESLLSSMRSNAFQLVIGGDCSILIGCGLALKSRGRYGLFFLDGHTDFMLPEHSSTGGAAGMDLALVTGHGPSVLSHINSIGPYFSEEDTFCVGNRELEPWYVDLIKSSDITYCDLHSSRKKSWSTIASGFLHMVTTKQLDGFWIHMDVDVLHDEIMPCVDSRQDDGMTYAEWELLMETLLSSKKCAGIDITIYDPSRDPDGKYLKQFSAVLLRMLAKV